MKFLYSLVVVLAVVGRWNTFGADVLPKNCIEEKVLSLVTKWRTGDDLLPSLEAIRITSIKDLKYEGYGLKATFTTGDMQLTGLNKLTVKELSVTPDNWNVSTTVQIPRLELTSEHYNLRGRAYIMYPVKGSGFMSVTFENVEVLVRISLDSKGAYMQVDDMKLDFSVGDIQAYLADSSWPVNDVLNIRANKIMEDYKKTFVSSAQERITSGLNTYLAMIAPAKSFNATAGAGVLCATSLPWLL